MECPDSLPDERLALLHAAYQHLTTWGRVDDFPALACQAMSALLRGRPTALYCVPEQGKGQCVVGAFHGVELTKVLATPFIQERLIVDPVFLATADNDGAWVTSNEAVMGADLAGDAARWRLFRQTFLDPLGFSDNLRVILTEGDGEWLGWCGAFETADARFFTIDDQRAMEALMRVLADGLRAWHTIAPAFGEPLWFLRDVTRSQAPVFAYTRSGIFLMANAACRVAYPEGPPWLAYACDPQADAERGWDRLALPYGGGRDDGDVVYIFARRAALERPCLAEQLVQAMGLKPRHRATALGLMQGLTNREIVPVSGLSRSTVDGYVKEIMRLFEVGTRAELVYEIAARFFDTSSQLWPVNIRPPRR
ncbi:MAG: hypothetical protein KC486_24000 [Myxococcales bacterium]|nr:hypothetical protein [Myxococcales bacterium]